MREVVTGHASLVLVVVAVAGLEVASLVNDTIPFFGFGLDLVLGLMCANITESFEATAVMLEGSYRIWCGGI